MAINKIYCIIFISLSGILYSQSSDYKCSTNKLKNNSKNREYFDTLKYKCNVDSTFNTNYYLISFNPLDEELRKKYKESFPITYVIKRKNCCIKKVFKGEIDTKAVSNYR